MTRLMLNRALQTIQNQNGGTLTRRRLQDLSDQSGVPLYHLEGLIGFFPHYRLDKKAPEYTVRVCRDMTCHARGATGAVIGQLEAKAKESGKSIHVEGASCLGRCDRAPAVLVEHWDQSHAGNGGHAHHPHEYLYLNRSPKQLGQMLLAIIAGQPPKPDSDHDSREYPHPKPGFNPWKIDPYGGSAKWEAIKKYVELPPSPAPDTLARLRKSVSRNEESGYTVPATRIRDLPRVADLLQKMETSTLRGMGGAGAPAFKKWQDTWEATEEEKFVVVNGDESEPATFKDRDLFVRVPWTVVEGTILAGLMLGAKRGYIYIRHEYPEAIEAVEACIKDAYAQNVCGKNILGTTRSFELEVFVSPGNYVCGEQSALIEAIEGNRAQPRPRPPELTTNGLFNKPTLLSNVETFAWVPAIYLNGGEWYRDMGANGYKGKRFFSISGDVKRPGVYEVPIGLPLRELIMGEDYCQGMISGNLKAMALSGPSGGFFSAKVPVERGMKRTLDKLPDTVPADSVLRKLPKDITEFDILDMELEIDISRILGLMLGAGMVVYGEKTDMVDQAKNALEFFRNESCGKCVPCRIGTQKLAEIGTELIERKYSDARLTEQKTLLAEMGKTMELTSICALGTSAHNPLNTVLKYFPGEVKAYLKGG